MGVYNKSGVLSTRQRLLPRGMGWNGYQAPASHRPKSSSHFHLSPTQLQLIIFILFISTKR